MPAKKIKISGVSTLLAQIGTLLQRQREIITAMHERIDRKNKKTSRSARLKKAIVK